MKWTRKMLRHISGHSLFSACDSRSARRNWLRFTLRLLRGCLLGARCCGCRPLPGKFRYQRIGRRRSPSLSLRARCFVLNIQALV